MFLVITIPTMVVSVVYNLWSYLSTVFYHYFGVYYLIRELVEGISVEFTIAVVLNIIYYGIKRILQALKFV